MLNNVFLIGEVTEAPVVKVSSATGELEVLFTVKVEGVFGGFEYLPVGANGATAKSVLKDIKKGGYVIIMGVATPEKVMAERVFYPLAV